MNQKFKVVLISILTIVALLTTSLAVRSVLQRNKPVEEEKTQEQLEDENYESVDNASDLTNSSFVSDNLSITIFGEDITISKNGNELSDEYKLHYSGSNQYLIVDNDQLLESEDYTPIKEIFPEGLGFTLNETDMSIEVFSGDQSLSVLNHQ